MQVWVVTYALGYPDDGDEVLGVFSTKAKAEAASQAARTPKGSPIHGCVSEAYEIDVPAQAWLATE